MTNENLKYWRPPLDIDVLSCSLFSLWLNSALPGGRENFFFLIMNTCIFIYFLLTLKAGVWVIFPPKSCRAFCSMHFKKMLICNATTF